MVAAAVVAIIIREEEEDLEITMIQMMKILTCPIRHYLNPIVKVYVPIIINPNQHGGIY